VRPIAQAVDRRNLNRSCWLLHCRPIFYVIGRLCLALIGPVTAIVKLDLPANPVDVGVFGAAALVPDAKHFDHGVALQGRWLVGKQTQR
jgi:hypothetical protein